VPSPKSREELIIEIPSAAERSLSRSSNKLRVIYEPKFISKFIPNIRSTAPTPGGSSKLAR